MERRSNLKTYRAFTIAVLALLLLSAAAWAQETILPLGDSITQGGYGYASYRYPLWFELKQGGYGGDFVGDQDEIYGGSPNLELYPDYYWTFDRHHEGHWGWRTDQVAGIIVGTVTANQPNIVLIHLGTNDIGQWGATGVGNAETHLRLIIDGIRSVQPTATLLLAQVIPIGPGNGYSHNADQVVPLNRAIAVIAREETMPESPIILVDQFSDFDLDTMMQSDGLHPNQAGENQMSQVWYAALAPLLDMSAVDPAPALNPLLIRAAPNPFNPSTTIRYELTEASSVTVRIFDARGRNIRTLIRDQYLQAGLHDSRWDGRDHVGVASASGVYFVHVRTGQQVNTTKITLAR